MINTHILMRNIPITDEYLRGLIETEGCFTYCSVPRRTKEGAKKASIPTFIFAMHERDRELVEVIKKYMGIDKKLYYYKSSSKDGYKRGGTVRLVVRDIGTIKNVIVPMFHEKLRGHKGRQFEAWIERMEKVPDSFKLIPKLCKTGFYRDR